jgi:hypothetical protein
VGFATWEDYNLALPPEQRDAWSACVDPTGIGPRLFFQRIPEGKVVKNRLHLDVRPAPGWAPSAWPRSRPKAHG